MRRAASLALAILIAACDEASAPATVRNECVASDNCRPNGSKKYDCYLPLNACVAERTDEPYPLILRIAASSEGTPLAEAGVQLVQDEIRELGTFSEKLDAGVLTVARAVQARGSVRDESGGGSLASQLVITPTDRVAPFLASAVETRTTSTDAGAGTQALPALLNPAVTYDIHVQPLLESSGKLPPMDMMDASVPFVIAYDPPAMRAGKFGRNPGPHMVRLEERGTGRVLSSTTRVNPDGGTFELYAAPEVFAQEEPNFDLVVSPAGFAPWQVTITIPGKRFLAGGEMYLPSVPAPRVATAAVEVADAGETLLRLPGAELLFKSSYRPAGDAGTESAGGADWCRWEDPSPISCRGEFRDFSDQHGNYEVELPPGIYDVIISPSQEDSVSLLVAATKNAEKMEIRDDSVPGNILLLGNTRAPWRGTVYVQALTGGTSSRVAAPNVTVRSSVRPTPPFSSWGEIANYNRPYGTASNGQGQFELYTDTGYYDFVVEPPADSNFPWKLWLDCPNGPDAGVALGAINLARPVLVSGVVEAEGEEDAGVRLPNARIEAFTVVQRRERPGVPAGPKRAVLIGRTVSDQNGVFHLVLPPQIGERQGTCEGRITDSARSRR